MLRYGRDRYLLYGVLQAVNAIALLLFGLQVSTAGGPGSGNSIPVLVGLVALCLLVVAVASVKRGRDLGLQAWITGVLLVVSLATGLLFLALLAYLALARGQAGSNALGPNPPALDVLGLGWGLMALIYPWVVVLLLERLL